MASSLLPNALSSSCRSSAPSTVCNRCRFLPEHRPLVATSSPRSVRWWPPARRYSATSASHVSPCASPAVGSEGSLPGALMVQLEAIHRFQTEGGRKSINTTNEEPRPTRTQGDVILLCTPLLPSPHRASTFRRQGAGAAGGRGGRGAGGGEGRRSRGAAGGAAGGAG